MATVNFPMVTGELANLVETMRKAQIEYDKLINDRDSNFGQHAVRRADQARKVAEQKVDLWLVSYFAEVKKYVKAFEPKETNELPGLYDVERDP
jgi:hypothetical protein